MRREGGGGGTMLPAAVAYLPLQFPSPCLPVGGALVRRVVGLFTPASSPPPPPLPCAGERRKADTARPRVQLGSKPRWDVRAADDRDEGGGMPLTAFAKPGGRRLHSPPQQQQQHIWDHALPPLFLLGQGTAAGRVVCRGWVRRVNRPPFLQQHKW
jgi:hypothetical protein